MHLFRSYNVPFRTEMYTFMFWMEHCGIWNRCILGFVKLGYDSFNTVNRYPCPFSCIIANITWLQLAGYPLLAPTWLSHDDVIKWKNFPRYWPFVRGIHRWPVKSPHKGQWRGVLMFFFLHLNKRLCKQSWDWWFETPSRPLWRHCNDIAKGFIAEILPSNSRAQKYCTHVSTKFCLSQNVMKMHNTLY